MNKCRSAEEKKRNLVFGSTKSYGNPESLTTTFNMKPTREEFLLFSLPRIQNHSHRNELVCAQCACELFSSISLSLSLYHSTIIIIVIVVMGLAPFIVVVVCLLFFCFLSIFNFDSIWCRSTWIFISCLCLHIFFYCFVGGCNAHLFCYKLICQISKFHNQLARCEHI